MAQSSRSNLKYDLFIPKRATFVLTMQLLDGDNEALDLDDHTFISQIRRTYEDKVLVNEFDITILDQDDPDTKGMLSN